MPLKFFMAVLFISMLIAVRQEAFSQDKATLQFEIHKLQFEGNRTYGSDELRKVVLTKETPGLFSKLLFGGEPEFLDHDIVQADLERLKEFYQDQGYFEAAVRESLAYDTTRTLVSVTFFIQENRPSLIDSLEILGLSELSPELLQT